jgi:hypothetical protein
MFRPAQPLFQPKPQVAGQGYSTPQPQVIQCPNNFWTHATLNQSVQRTQAAQNPLQGEQKCYACGERGHFANQCPTPCSRPPQTAVSTTVAICGANSILVAAKQNYVRGKVNHVTVEEAQEAPDMVIGMFFVNDTSAVVLFEGPEKATRGGRGGGGEWEPIKILRQELAYVPSSNPKVETQQQSDEHSIQHHRNDPLKVMNAVEKECDQLDTRLARYDQNSEQTLLLKPWTGYVRFWRIYPVTEPNMSGLPRNFLPNFDS